MGLFDIKQKKKRVLKKNMNWTQAKSRYPKLSPFGDADKDGVKNMFDCKPFDKKRQDDLDDELSTSFERISVHNKLIRLKEREKGLKRLSELQEDERRLSKD